VSSPEAQYNVLPAPTGNQIAEIVETEDVAKVLPLTLIMVGDKDASVLLEV
jgi:hypothetical protein